MPVGRRSIVWRSKSREQPAAQRLAGAALEQHVVGQHDGGAAVDVEDRHDVLQEVELLVGRRDDEVLALDLAVLAHLASVGADHRQRRLAAERRVRQHHGPALAGVGDQGVLDVDERVAVRRPDAVEQQVHRRQPRGAVDELEAGDELVAQVLALGRRQARGVAGGVLVGGEQEAAGAAGRVDDGVSRRWAATTSTIAWMSARGVKYWPAPEPCVGGALGEQLLVGVALDVGAGGRPVLLVDEVDDEPLELGRVLDPVLGLPEDRAERARLLRKPDAGSGCR